MQTNRYPIGTQSFRVLREFDSVYVDKTAYIYRMAHSASRIYFLSRPRRFGKSLLLSTFHAYFEGEKELFKGLYIYDREEEWQRYPVLHFDLSASEGISNQRIEAYLRTKLKNYSQQYEVELEDPSLGVGAVFGFLIEAICKKTGRRVVVLIDEYDKGIVDLLDDEEQLLKNQKLLQPFFSQIKAQDQYIRFCLITGVSRFRHFTLFSGFNNPNDISLDKEYAAICGVTHEEMLTQLGQGVQNLAKALGESLHETLDLLKLKYDGYRFSADPVMVFNPFSILNCLDKGELNNFWLASGTSRVFVRYLEKISFDFTELEDLWVTKEDLESTFNTESPISLLFQTGYLTIIDFEDGLYKLGIPNGEVKSALVKELVPRYMGIPENNLPKKLLKFKRMVLDGDIDGFLSELKSMMVTVPYHQFHMENEEKTYHLFIYQAFLMIGVDARSEIAISGGRIDMMAQTPKYVYVMEFKLNDTPEHALQQIEKRGYALPWASDHRKVFKIGVSFDSATRTISHWVIKAM